MMKLSADKIRRYSEARLQGQVLPLKDAAVVRCPFHEDRKPSMSINFSKAVWNCNAGCGGGGLVDFERKLTSCDAETAKARIADLVGEPQLFGNGQRAEAVYDYHDPQGHLVFQKLRYPGKRFVIRKPNGHNGYDYKLGDIVKPLYHLPEVLVANEVIITEGEKDCDNVRALNLSNRDAGIFVAVTTGFAGAGKWNDSDAVYFAGKRVLILPDNDEPGRKHAERVAHSLHPLAAGIKVVNLPGLHEKGDVSDYLESHTAQDLIAEIKKASPWSPAAPVDNFFVDVTTFANSVPDEIDWAVKPIIPRGWNGFIIADPKSLKSYSALDLLISLSLGAPWLEFEVLRRMRTALLAREDYWGLTAWRAKNFLRDRRDRLAYDTRDLADWMWINTRAQAATWTLDNDSDLQRLIFELKQRHIEFVILDVFRRLHFADENDNTEMQAVLDRVARIQAEVGCAVGIVHHSNKQDGWIFNRVRGASAIHGFMEWGIGLTTENPEDPPSRRVRKMEFLSKAGCEPDPIFVKSEGNEVEGWIRLVRTERPTTNRKRSGAEAAALMVDSSEVRGGKRVPD